MTYATASPRTSFVIAYILSGKFTVRSFIGGGSIISLTRNGPLPEPARSVFKVHPSRRRTSTTLMTTGLAYTTMTCSGDC